MPDETKQTQFEILFEAEGRSSGKMRNDISVRWADEEWKLPTDEGPFHGGDSTAPPPLAYFAAAHTGCIMTQIRAFSKRLNIPIRGVTVSSRFQWKGVQIGREPYESEPVGFGLDIDIDSDAPAEDLKRLVEAAQKGCFIDQTLTRANVVDHRLRVGDDWVDV